MMRNHNPQIAILKAMDSLSASIPFSASDGEKVAKPDEVSWRVERGSG
jgi:hypothetical protein